MKSSTTVRVLSFLLLMFFFLPIGVNAQGPGERAVEWLDEFFDEWDAGLDPLGDRNQSTDTDFLNCPTGNTACRQCKAECTVSKQDAQGACLELDVELEGPCVTSVNAKATQCSTDCEQL